MGEEPPFGFKDCDLFGVIRQVSLEGEKRSKVYMKFTKEKEGRGWDHWGNFGGGTIGVILGVGFNKWGPD